jgi:hypothetical protein
MRVAEKIELDSASERELPTVWRAARWRHSCTCCAITSSMPSSGRRPMARSHRHGLAARAQRQPLVAGRNSLLRGVGLASGSW